jgi:hypothetical protein
MNAVIVLKFNFDFFFINDAGEEVHLIISFFYLSWAILRVLECFGKLLITPFSAMFHLVNVATIHLEI